MNITLKLYAALGDFLPPGAHENTLKMDVADGTTVAEVLNQHHVPLDSCHLILINGYYHHRELAGGKQLTNGDALAVWPPIAGG